MTALRCDLCVILEMYSGAYVAHVNLNSLSVGIFSVALVVLEVNVNLLLVDLFR